MSSESLHEAPEQLSAATIDAHRAYRSLIEEFEAIDWYHQRVEASADPELARVLAHARDEEKEHAAMVLEWLRRQDPALDRQLRKYLFTTDPLPLPEGGGSGEPGLSAGGGDTLGIGSLRGAPISGGI